MSDVSKTEAKPEDSRAAEPQGTNWLSEMRGLLAMLLAVIGFHSFIAKPFYIPSISMMPNLLVGDQLIVSKYPYGWSWVSASLHFLPRSKTRIMPATPAYGDIVIVVPPDRDEDYIKRVVALPGDRIAVVNGQIVLNGKPGSAMASFRALRPPSSVHPRVTATPQASSSMPKRVLATV